MVSSVFFIWPLSVLLIPGPHYKVIGSHKIRILLRPLCTKKRTTAQIIFKTKITIKHLQLVCRASAVSSFMALELCTTMESTTITTSHPNLITGGGFWAESCGVQGSQRTVHWPPASAAGRLVPKLAEAKTGRWLVVQKVENSCNPYPSQCGPRPNNQGKVKTAPVALTESVGSWDSGQCISASQERMLGWPRRRQNWAAECTCKATGADSSETVQSHSGQFNYSPVFCICMVTYTSRQIEIQMPKSYVARSTNYSLDTSEIAKPLPFKWPWVFSIGLVKMQWLSVLMRFTVSVCQFGNKEILLRVLKWSV